MRRLNKLAVVVAVLVYAGFLLCVATVVYGALATWVDERYFTVYPTPDRKSTFFDAYDLVPAITPVRNAQFPYYGGGPTVGVAGDTAAHRTRELSFVFALMDENPQQLMDSLRQNIAEQLHQSGVDIVASTGDAKEGYRFVYRQREGTGVVVLKPVEVVDPYEVRARTDAHPNPILKELGPNEYPVRVTVKINETWPRS